MTMPQLKPSPVDESSLKHALQRVEDRLRQQDVKRKKNEHHERTLKLAREFAARGVRQRQREWERQNRKKSIQQPTPHETQTKNPSPRVSSNSSNQGAVIKPWRDSTKPQTSDTPNEGTRTRPREKKQIDTRQTSKKVIPLQEASAFQLPEAEEKKAPTRAPAVPIEAIHSAPGTAPRKGLMRLMPIVAWLILGAGLVGAVLSWTTISDVHANTFQMDAANYQALPMGLLLGFAYLATGVLGFAFFWVSSLISNQLKEIRRLLFLQPMMSERSNQRPPV